MAERWIDPWGEDVPPRAAMGGDLGRGDDVPRFGPQPTHALDADVTLYWPWVRPCWENR